jgi:hypothetical protein
VDLLSVGGTVVSQSGSSGGSVVNLSDGKLAGIIVTATVGTTTASRDLFAITLAHIDRSLHSEGMGGILSVLSQDVTKEADAFDKNIAPSETKKLTDVLDKN